jgi:hypothetical protein
MSRRIAPLLCLAVVAAASGCAQWQQDSDSVAATFDQRLLATCASILGEQPTPAVKPARRPTTPRVLDLHATKTAAPPARRQPRVQPAAAEEPLEAPETSIAAQPIAQATPIAAAARPVQIPTDPPFAAPTTTATLNACTDTCCVAGPGEPHAFNCPLLNRCRTCPACLLGQRCVRQLFTRPEPGPPPIRYQPELPPKFLPVPTQPVLSPARPEAPDPWHGEVEFSWRPEVTFPGRD